MCDECGKQRKKADLYGGLRVYCKCGARMELRGESGLFRCPHARGLSSLADDDHPVVPLELVDPELQEILQS